MSVNCKHINVIDLFNKFYMNTGQFVEMDTSVFSSIQFPICNLIFPLSAFPVYLTWMSSRYTDFPLDSYCYCKRLYCTSVFHNGRQVLIDIFHEVDCEIVKRDIRINSTTISYSWFLSSNKYRIGFQHEHALSMRCHDGKYQHVLNDGMITLVHSPNNNFVMNGI